MEDHEISKLVDLADTLVYKKTGQHLDAEEKNILRQSLKGKKLSAIRCFGLTGSYVQRGLAQRLWQRLSEGLGENVGKRNVLKVLQKRKSQQTPPGTVLEKQCLASPQRFLNGHAALNGSASYLDLRNGKSTSSEPHEASPSFAGVSYCINPDCTNRQNPNHLNSCQACGTRLLLNGQVGKPSQADYTSSKKVEDCSPDSTAQEFHSSSQGKRSEDSGETNSASHSLPTLVNFLKPGVPLLLSIGVLGCSFGLSWLANWYGLMNHLDGQLPQAQRGYEIALKLNPWSPEAHYNQGVAYEDEQNYQGAHDEYQLAIKGGLIEAYNNQARLYILEGNYEAAVSLLRIALPLAKDDRVRADMYKNRGWARLEQGHLALAKIDLKEAIKLKSNRAPAYCLMAQVVEREGNEQGAEDYWFKCLGFSHQPETPEQDKWVELASQRLKPKEGVQ